MISVNRKEGQFWFCVSCWSSQPNHPLQITISFVLTLLWLTLFVLWNTVVLPASCFWANTQFYLTGHMNWSCQCVHLCFTSQPWIIPLQLAYLDVLEEWSSIWLYVPRFPLQQQWEAKDCNSHCLCKEAEWFKTPAAPQMLISVPLPAVPSQLSCPTGEASLPLAIGVLSPAKQHKPPHTPASELD